MDIEPAARELKMLAKRETLSPAEFDRVDHLMEDLKRMGMSNPEIVELTDGRWSLSTVKGNTRGVKAKDPAPWQSAASLLSEMLSRDMSLADVSQAMATATEIEGMGKSLSDVVTFMTSLKEKKIDLDQVAQAISLSAELDKLGTSISDLAAFTKELEQGDIDLAAFVSLFYDWDEAELKPVDAQSALKYKTELEQAGFEMEALPWIAEAASKFGGVEQIIEAVAKYGSMSALNDELQTKQKELESLDTEIKNGNKKLINAGQELEKARGETANFKKELATHKKLEALSFDEKALGELKKAAGKYGGPSEVLSAVNSFTALSDIKASYKDVEGKVQKQTEKIENLKGRYAHLKSAIDMCQKLLDEYKLGPEAIATILSAAEKYGETIEILRALEAYGKVDAVNEKFRQLVFAEGKIEDKIEQLKKVQAGYEAGNEVILEQIKALSAKSIEVGRAVGIVEEQTKKDSKAREILNLLQNPATAIYEESLPLVLVLLRSISIWAIINKNKLHFPSLLDKSLEEAIRHLGGS